MRQVLAFLLVLNLGFSAQALESPRFRVEQGAVDDLPLLMTRVDARIDGVIAEVQVTQLYKNDGTTPLEAVYMFPASRDAAVHRLVLTVEDRRLNARVYERKEAKQRYETALQEGRTASLLEQADPRLLEMRVANVLPGEEIRVELSYTERLHFEDGAFRFRYPAVARPSALDSGDTGSTVVTASDSGRVGFDLGLDLESGVPLERVDVASHAVELDHRSPSRVRIRLAPEESFGGDRDFVLEFAPESTDLGSGLLTWSDGEEHYFLLLAQPPESAPAQWVPPREYIFVVDVSGSMGESGMAIARAAMQNLLETLRPDDLFNVVLFASASEVLSSEPVQATASWQEQALDLIRTANSGGGTQLLPALRRVTGMPLREGVSRSVVVITDGGIGLAHDTLQFVRDKLGDANLFVLGTGRDEFVDQTVVARLARAGRGEAMSVRDAAGAASHSPELMRAIASPVLTDLQISTEGFSIIDNEPESLPDLFTSRPAFVVGRYDGSTTGVLHLQGVGGRGPYRAEFPLESAGAGGESLKYLWARERLRWLEDLRIAGAEVRQDMVDLGLRYNLLTRYTSFLAEDLVVRADGTVAPVDLTRTAGGSASGHGFALPSISIALGLAAQRLAMIPTDRPKPGNDALDGLRPSITFILGEDPAAATNRYFDAAAEVFKHNPEWKTDRVVRHVRSLAEVRRELAARRPQGGHWGLVNLVVHGSPWTGMRLRLGEYQSDANLFSIRQALAAGRNPSVDVGLDGRSELRIFGCGIGHAPELMAGIGRLLGGPESGLVIRSPRHFVHFDQGRAFQRQQWWALVPERACNDEQAIRERFNRRWPELRIPWNEFFTAEDSCGTRQGLGADRVRISVKLDANMPMSKDDRLDARRLASRLPGVMAQLDLLDGQVADLDWRFEAGQLIGQGWMLRYRPQDAIAARDLAIDFSDKALSESIRISGQVAD